MSDADPKSEAVIARQRNLDGHQGSGFLVTGVPTVIPAVDADNPGASL